IEEFPALDTDPGDESLRRELGLLGPHTHEVDDLVARVMGNPPAAQGSPSSFFSLTYSSEISAITASFFASLASSCATRASRSASRVEVRPFGVSKTVAAFSNNCRCQP